MHQELLVEFSCDFYYYKLKTCIRVNTRELNRELCIGLFTLYTLY